MTTLGDWFYNDGSGEQLLTLEWDADPNQAAGYGVGFLPSGDPIIQRVTLGEVTDPGDPLQPVSPALIGSMPSRTSVHLAWVEGDDSGRPPVTAWQAEVRASTDNGVSFGAWGSVAGSPFAATTVSVDLSSLSTGTPEVLREYRVRGVNADGPGQYSNVVPLQWNVEVPARPTAPANFRDLGANTVTTHDVGWDAATAQASHPIDKYGLFLAQATLTDPNTVYVDNIDPSLLTWTIQNLTQGGVLSNINVRAHNDQGWGPASNRIDLQQPSEPPVPSEFLMGSSDSGHGAGGLDWDVWRAFTRGTMLQHANDVGMARPKALLYSVDGSPLGSSGNAGVSTLTYSAIFNYCLSELNNFYYTTDTGQTHTARWGIRLYWSNGSENSDKGILSGTHTATAISNFTNVSQKALYDACHFIDPTTGQRRFPDAYAGSNPTQEQERTGIVADWLHPSAKYHDFVAWSMYPPGRGVNDTSLSRNPRWDWPSFDESQRLNIQRGFLLRCYYRTKQAESQARVDTGDNTRRLIIGTAETGIASDPDDRATRPYYAVHGLVGSMNVLARQYNLAHDFCCWWDQQTATTAPHDILNDEPPNSDHLSFATGTPSDNSIATNPSTAVAWKNWRLYDKRIAGSTQPAQWAGKPGNIDNYTGTPI